MNERFEKAVAALAQKLMELRPLFEDVAATVAELRHYQGVPAFLSGAPMLTAPKDRPILAFCDHEVDPYWQDESNRTLTIYAAHADNLDHAETGFHVIEWGGEQSVLFDEELPDWWFVVGTDFEKAANPLAWWELPVMRGVEQKLTPEASEASDREHEELLARLAGRR